MPSKVLDVELTDMPQQWGAWPERYTRLYIVLRYEQVPIGRIWIARPPNSASLNDTIMHAIYSTPKLLKNLNRLELSLRLRAVAASTQPITVAICTRNRPDDLRRCLKALEQLPDDGQEILVVDNAPPDDQTWQVVQTCQTLNVRYVREDKPGLNNARNRALIEATHDIVAFNDDDAQPEADWLRCISRNFQEQDVMMVTGLTVPIELETKAQEWFETHSTFVRGFERKVFHLSNLAPMYAARAGAGANMALRRSVLQKIGRFDPALDTGTATKSGGDSEIMMRIMSAGYRIVYDPAAVNWHRHRDSEPALRKVFYGYGVGSYAAIMRRLVVDKDLMMPIFAFHWLRYDQVPDLMRALLRRPKRKPIRYLLIELLGCLVGPWAYLYERRRQRS